MVRGKQVNYCSNRAKFSSITGVSRIEEVFTAGQQNAGPSTIGYSINSILDEDSNANTYGAYDAFETKAFLSGEISPKHVDLLEMSLFGGEGANKSTGPDRTFQPLRNSTPAPILSHDMVSSYLSVALFVEYRLPKMSPFLAAARYAREQHREQALNPQ